MEELRGAWGAQKVYARGAHSGVGAKIKHEEKRVAQRERILAQLVAKAKAPTETAGAAESSGWKSKSKGKKVLAALPVSSLIFPLPARGEEGEGGGGGGESNLIF
jgi:hypothetical protein